MKPVFDLPSGLCGRFGVVKLWPKIKAAEDEVIARLQNTAEDMGLACVVVDHMGRCVDAPFRQMTQADLDFVIHLHFETPKAYDIFSFVALWNPLQFYHDWGYRRYVANLLTHDDFLSCDSEAADDIIRRSIQRDPTRLPPEFTLFHSLSTPICEPTLGDNKIFYAGINWERLGKGKSRHQDILDQLDQTGHLRIYGPRSFQGVQVWKGYKSYQEPLPFDGKTIITEINKAGIVLALSSDAHKQSALMSNRLFEGLAGGAVVICDENPFAQRHFGDALLYIDTTMPADDVVDQIDNHLRWIKRCPDEALALARRAQKIFQEKFRLDHSLRQIYEGLPERRARLRSLFEPQRSDAKAVLYCIMPEYQHEVLQQHLVSLKSQTYTSIEAVLLVDSINYDHDCNAIDAAVSAAGVNLTIKPVTFFQRDGRNKIMRRRPIGSVLTQLLLDDLPARQALYFGFLGANEQLFSEHISRLIGALERNPESDHAYSAVLLKQKQQGEWSFHYDNKFGLDNHLSGYPVGYGRALFRVSAFAAELASLLPYLDHDFILGLALYKKSAVEFTATCIMTHDAWHEADADPARVERERRAERDMLRDWDPVTYDQLDADQKIVDRHLAPITISLENMTKVERLKMLAKLVGSLPFPRITYPLLRWIYTIASRGRQR